MIIITTRYYFFFNLLSKECQVIYLLKKLSIFISAFITPKHRLDPLQKDGFGGAGRAVDGLLRSGLRGIFLLHTCMFHHGSEGLHLSFAAANLTPVHSSVFWLWKHIFAKRIHRRMVAKPECSFISLQ